MYCVILLVIQTVVASCVVSVAPCVDVASVTRLLQALCVSLRSSPTCR